MLNVSRSLNGIWKRSNCVENGKKRQETPRIRNGIGRPRGLVVLLAVAAMVALPALGQDPVSWGASAISGSHADQIRIVNLHPDSKRPGRKARAIDREGVVSQPDIDHGNKPAQATPVDFVLDGSQVVARYGVNGDANNGDSVSSHGGPIVVSNDVQLIFWGNWWKSASNPGTGDVIGMVQDVLGGPYLSELTQYGFLNLSVRKPILVASDPPSSFNSGDVDNLVWDLIDQGTFSEPDDGSRFVYIVFMPTMATSDSSARGAHGDATDYDFPFDVDHAWVGWVSGGDLAYITDVFTHELVESITDPEPDNAAWQMNRTINGGNEIGDACNNTADFLNGLFVQAYWSQKQRACAIPFGTRSQLDVKELRLQGSWIQADLSAIISDKPPAFPAVGNPFAYVTPDRIPRIIYRGLDNHIHELRRLLGSWIQTDLSAIVSDNPPASPAAGDPFAYVTPDGIARVVYRGLDNHIHELRLQGSWFQADLSTVVSDNPPASPAAGDPFAYVTPDGIARVVYRSLDNHIHELRLQGSWFQADLSAIVSDNPPASPAAGDPFAYVTPDRIARVVYRGLDNHIHEIRLQGSWFQADLSTVVSDNPPASPAAGDPFAYVTPDGIARVVYRGLDNHIHEIRLQGSWFQADLSAIVSDNPPASPAAGDPFAYVTPDGIARVVYRGLDNHIHEIRLQGSWFQADLSAIVSDNPPASPAAGDPFAYVTPDGIARVVYR